MTPFTGTKPQRGVRATFSTLVDAFVTWLLDVFFDELIAASAQISANAANAAAAVSAIPNSMWVSGTYALGAVAWSPTDYLDYRCRTAGSRTIDPALDPTNWQLRTNTSSGGATTTSSAVDITLTSANGRLQIISMTAASKKVTLPVASTLQKGSPVFVFQNKGAYRFSVHKNGGGFLCYVNPGQVIAAHCSDISTGTGIWQSSGQAVERIYTSNTAEVLNAVDSISIAVAMLSATKAICAFRNDSTTYLNAVIINYGSASGTPVAINAEASTGISIAAQTSSQATVVYKSPTGTTKGYVLDNPSGTTITPGTVATIDAGINGTATSIAALSSSQLLCLYNLVSGNTPRERILDIAASVITASAEVVADATNMLNYPRVVKISSAKALAAFRTSVDNSIRLRLQSITGSVPAPTGSVLAIALLGSYTDRMFGIAVLSTSRALLVREVDRTYSDIMITLLDISGTSPTVVRNLALRVGLDLSTNVPAHVGCTKLTANSVHVCWTGCQSGGIDAMTVTVTSDDRITVSAITDRTEPGVSSANGYFVVDALDSTHVLQCCRNSSTYLSAKTLELPA